MIITSININWTII